mmetsp:Transcript_12323/g.28889  ORF Transcript_12323/g.28889 Transcript_12323/m.28889 type:complete len:210 (-) Transcript_12323:365-994(-)
MSCKPCSQDIATLEVPFQRLKLLVRLQKSLSKARRILAEKTRKHVPTRPICQVSSRHAPLVHHRDAYVKARENRWVARPVARRWWMLLHSSSLLGHLCCVPEAAGMVSRAQAGAQRHKSRAPAQRRIARQLRQDLNSQARQESEIQRLRGHFLCSAVSKLGREDAMARIATPGTHAHRRQVGRDSRHRSDLLTRTPRPCWNSSMSSRAR